MGCVEAEQSMERPTKDGGGRRWLREREAACSGDVRFPRREARKIAIHVVRKRLAACVNIVLGPIQSIYRWKGRVQNAREVLNRDQDHPEAPRSTSWKEVKHWHSYDVPEFLVISVTGGSREYLEWLERECPAQRGK